MEAATSMAPPLTSPVVSTVTTTTHFFRLIAMARQSLGQICPAILIQMGDAKAHKWMMPKHG